MAKLPVVSAREVIRALAKIGFMVVRQKGSHMTLQRGKPPETITVPNHNPLKPGMLRRIIRDAGLTVDEFVALL